MAKERGDTAVQAVAEGRMADAAVLDAPVDRRTEWQKYWAVFVAGGALFSDGYIAASIGPVITMIKKIYPKETKASKAFSLLASVAFIGVVVGQLSFGVIVDKVGRKLSLLVATGLLIFWTIMCTGAYGYHGSIPSLLVALTVYRCFLGFALGAEYPASSTTAGEAAAECKPGTRHGVFALVTNTAIDLGFVVGPLVAYIVVLITGENHLRVAWRVVIGLGIVFPVILFFFRAKFVEPKASRIVSPARDFNESAKLYYLAFRKYWRPIISISVIWFIYDLVAYSFGIFSSVVSEALVGEGNYAKSLAIATAINAFYLPGAIAGVFLVDKLTPRYTMLLGLISQATIGFFFAGFYPRITPHIAGYTVLTGVFLAFGELVGDTIGMVATLSYPSVVRGQLYSISAAIGKVGAFTGAYIWAKVAYDFDHENPDSIAAYRGEFYVSSALLIVAAVFAIFGLPKLSQDCVEEENAVFLDHLRLNGFDTSRIDNDHLRAAGSSSSQEKGYLDSKNF